MKAPVELSAAPAAPAPPDAAGKGDGIPPAVPPASPPRESSPNLEEKDAGDEKAAPSRSLSVLRFHAVKSKGGKKSGTAVLLDVRMDLRTVAVLRAKTHKLKCELPWSMFEDLPLSSSNPDARRARMRLSHADADRRTLAFASREEKRSFLARITPEAAPLTFTSEQMTGGGLAQQQASWRERCQLAMRGLDDSGVHAIELLEGEEVLFVADTVVGNLLGSSSMSDGALRVTNYRITFQPSTFRDLAALQLIELVELSAAHGLVWRVEYDRAKQLTLHCKDSRSIVYRFASSKVAAESSSMLKARTFPAALEDSFAFAHRLRLEELRARAALSEEEEEEEEEEDDDDEEDDDEQEEEDDDEDEANASEANKEEDEETGAQSIEAAAAAASAAADPAPEARPGRVRFSSHVDEKSASEYDDVVFQPSAPESAPLGGPRMPRFSSDTLSLVSTPEALALDLHHSALAEDEYRRLGLIGGADGGGPWRVTHANMRFQLCPSYPPMLVVPAAADDLLLTEVAAYRSRGRVPYVVWRGPSGAVIARSSQPGVGLAGTRSRADEELVRLVRQAGPTPDRLVIIDARPKINAVGNQLKGKGYESEANYAGCETRFMGIENIHQVRGSYQAVQKLFETGKNKNFLTRLEQSKWLQHLRDIMDASVMVANLLQRDRVSVLVHCSDGWDRTSQISALAQLLLDPHYRTLAGFTTLIQKEWLWPGHKFAQRCGNMGRGGVSASSANEWSPVFLQFLDCAHQLLNQFPHAFEFSQQLLLDTAREAYGGRFGTFFYNNESERAAAGVASRTASFWFFVATHPAMYTNRFYKRVGKPLPRPATSIQSLRLWEAYFGQWSRSKWAGGSQVSATTPFHLPTLNDAFDALQAEVERLKADGGGGGGGDDAFVAALERGEFDRLRAAADAGGDGAAAAAFLVGCALYRGGGRDRWLEADEEEALRLWRAAGRAGHKGALLRLGQHIL